MSLVESLQKAIEYMEAHLLDELNIGWALNTKVTLRMDYSAVKYLPQNGQSLKP